MSNPSLADEAALKPTGSQASLGSVSGVARRSSTRRGGSDILVRILFQGKGVLLFVANTKETGKELFSMACQALGIFEDWYFSLYVRPRGSTKLSGDRRWLLLDRSLGSQINADTPYASQVPLSSLNEEAYANPSELKKVVMGSMADSAQQARAMQDASFDSLPDMTSMNKSRSTEQLFQKLKSEGQLHPDVDLSRMRELNLSLELVTMPVVFDDVIQTATLEYIYGIVVDGLLTRKRAQRLPLHILLEVIGLRRYIGWGHYQEEMYHNPFGDSNSVYYEAPGTPLEAPQLPEESMPQRKSDSRRKTVRSPVYEELPREDTGDEAEEFDSAKGDDEESLATTPQPVITAANNTRTAPAKLDSPQGDRRFDWSVPNSPGHLDSPGRMGSPTRTRNLSSEGLMNLGIDDTFEKEMQERCAKARKELKRPHRLMPRYMIDVTAAGISAEVAEKILDKYRSGRRHTGDSDTPNPKSGAAVYLWTDLVEEVHAAIESETKEQVMMKILEKMRPYFDMPYHNFTAWTEQNKPIRFYIDSERIELFAREVLPADAEADEKLRTGKGKNLEFRRPLTLDNPNDYGFLSLDFKALKKATRDDRLVQFEFEAGAVSKMGITFVDEVAAIEVYQLVQLLHRPMRILMADPPAGEITVMRAQAQVSNRRKQLEWFSFLDSRRARKNHEDQRHTLSQDRERRMIRIRKMRGEFKTVHKEVKPLSEEAIQSNEEMVECLKNLLERNRLCRDAIEHRLKLLEQMKDVGDDTNQKLAKFYNERLTHARQARLALPGSDSEGSDDDEDADREEETFDQIRERFMTENESLTHDVSTLRNRAIELGGQLELQEDKLKSFHEGRERLGDALNNDKS